MACYAPITAWRSQERSENGKRAIVFNKREGYADMQVTLPCGGCVGCRKEKARQWTVRCMHEASLHLSNCFITLTYSDQNLPDNGSLEKRDFQLFMKRLRKQFPGTRIRFFGCGEYGDAAGRPHYHTLLFGHDFSDKYISADRDAYTAWRSPTLEALWPLGLSEIGSFSPSSAAYIARYCIKKVSTDMSDHHYTRVNTSTGEMITVEPEFLLMSRRPGIARGWVDRFGYETYLHDAVVMNGFSSKPPRYYDSVMDSKDPDLMKRIRREREKDFNPEEQTWKRLEAREQCAIAKVNLSPGGQL